VHCSIVVRYYDGQSEELTTEARRTRRGKQINNFEFPSS
jgi:hypothetical protein